MKLVTGGDHAGFSLKQHVNAYLEKQGHEVIDVGAYSTDPVDFPDVARKMASAIFDGKAERGIMCCGTGVGAQIALNKIAGIRASLCHDTHCAAQCVEHDDVQIIAMGAWIVGTKIAEDVIERFLAAKFKDQDYFRRRIEKLGQLELESARRVLGKAE